MMIILSYLAKSKFFRSFEGAKGLFEIRNEQDSSPDRIFCRVDRGYLVVSFNGFQKIQKTQE